VAHATLSHSQAGFQESFDINQPAQALQTIPLSSPLMVWGLDIVGRFPRAVGSYQYLLVAIDKFTM
jgi:hypothetical protein